MTDKLTDPEAVAKLVEDTHTDIARISTAVEEIRRYMHWLAERQDQLAARLAQPRAPRDTAATPPQYRSGRWIMRDGTFPPGATGIAPAGDAALQAQFATEGKGAVDANTAPGNLRPPD